ncbi:MAG: hypothetical protein LOD94_07460 [Gammaproteobacteria bacterium]|nr:hypothetical protein [Gammaproteobacteria bacterium]
MSETTATVSGRTGETCNASGPYRSQGPSGAVVFIQEGDAFPPDVDGSPTVWTLLFEESDAA